MFDSKSYRINGRKWWFCGAVDPRCEIAIVIGIAKNNKKKKHEKHSMILIPLDTKDVKINRALNFYGYDYAPTFES
jgi:alkylation response protein AidB-like acyl-CoA dehydrogenase